MNCTYCRRPGRARVAGQESCVCDQCWSMLQDPRTALPLIRGHLTAELRGKVPPERLSSMIDEFMGVLSRFKRPG